MARRARPIFERRLSEAVDDPSLGQIVRRHFQLYAIAVGETNEAFAHLPRNMRENTMLVAELDAEHGSGEDGGDFTFSFDNVVNWHKQDTASAAGGSAKGTR